MQLVSIIVPIYNVENYLERCLDSLVQQTYAAIEIILVNDGSTDNSLQIAKQYTERYPNIKLINQSNKGLSGARNTGLNVAKGEYVLYVDSDDYISLNAVDEMVNAMEDADIVESCCMSVDETGKEALYNYHSPEDIGEFNLKEHPEKLLNVAMFVGGHMYRRDFINDLQFPEGLVHEDVFYTSVLFHDVKRIRKANNAIYYYFMRSDSISNHVSIKMFDMYEIMKRIVQYYEEHSWGVNEIITKIYVRSFLIAVLFRKASYLSEDYSQLREEMRQRAICFLNEKHKNWVSNPYITPKEKLATMALHSKLAMNIIWKGAKKHD